MWHSAKSGLSSPKCKYSGLVGHVICCPTDVVIYRYHLLLMCDIDSPLNTERCQCVKCKMMHNAHQNCCVSLSKVQPSPNASSFCDASDFVPAFTLHRPACISVLTSVCVRFNHKKSCCISTHNAPHRSHQTVEIRSDFTWRRVSNRGKLNAKKYMLGPQDINAERCSPC